MCIRTSIPEMSSGDRLTPPTVGCRTRGEKWDEKTQLAQGQFVGRQAQEKLAWGKRPTII